MQFETSAHRRRVEVLVSLLPANRRFHEICEHFDQAVEFAACEGLTIAEGIEEFFEIDGGGPGRDELRKIVVPSGSALGKVPSGYRLPVMPKAASKLLKTSDEHASCVEIERIASSDPVLAGRLLQAANSALFGARYEIVRLRDAVLRLGVPNARKTLLGACMEGLFGSKPLQELWQHSQGVAELSWELATMAGEDRETAFTAGLLHDVGRLALMGRPAAERVAEQKWLNAGFPLAYAETLVYGIDHAAYGADLLKRWEIPADVVHAVATHHRPARLPKGVNHRLAAVVCLAEDLATQGDLARSEDLWPLLRRRAAETITGFPLEAFVAQAKGPAVRAAG